MFSAILKIKNSLNKEVSAPDDIAYILLSNFFPPHLPNLMPISDSMMSEISHIAQLSNTLLTLVVVRIAIFKASPLKGPRDDGLLALV